MAWAHGLGPPTLDLPLQQRRRLKKNRVRYQAFHLGLP
jgi:hypothetical protein